MDRKLSLLGFAVMFLIGSDTFVVAPLLPSLAKTFEVSTSQSGWLVSVYAIGYAVTGLVSGPVSDRGNRRTILTLGMVVFALATAACAVSWTAGCFSDSACLCFRLPSLSPGNRFRPRRECDTLGLSEDGHDCISARSTRQYP